MNDKPRRKEFSTSRDNVFIVHHVFDEKDIDIFVVLRNKTRKVDASYLGPTIDNILYEATLYNENNALAFTDALRGILADKSIKISKGKFPHIKWDIDKVNELYQYYYLKR